MTKEIEEEVARELAFVLRDSFAQSPNGRLKQVGILADINQNRINILDYTPEDLLGNPIIRNTLFKSFRDVEKHPHRLKKSDKNLEKAFTKELEQGLRRARNELEI